MSSFGRNLRRQRELRGISLEEIAQHTKIGTRMLEAIETDRFQLLPGGVFNRSFVLAYARYLGLDEQEVAAEFDQLHGGSTPEVDVKKVAAQRERQAAEKPAAPAEALPVQPPRRARAISVTILVIAAAVGAVAFRFPNLLSRLRPAQSEAAPPVASPASAQPEPAAVPAATPPPAAAGSTQPRLRLQVDTVGTSWVMAWADDKKAWEAEMKAREVHTIEARSSIKLRVGNAGVVVLTLNGETQPPLGRLGEAKTVTFTSEDLKQSDANNGQDGRRAGPG